MHVCARERGLSGRCSRVRAVRVTAQTADVRPIIMAAVLRDITFTPGSYRSFMDLQEKLHQNIGRKRSLVAIGTHDLDAVHGPFTYEVLPPEQIRFRAINQETEHTAAELMTIYQQHAQLRHFLPLLSGKARYPVILDADRTVLSMPPIINGYQSRITLNTRNVFIECTGTDPTKTAIVLNVILAMFSRYCAPMYAAEEVEVRRADGSTVWYPDLSTRIETVSVDYINRSVGVTLTAPEIVALLHRMGLPAEPSPSAADCVAVEIGPSRADILHACDIMEDVAIAYGFNKIPHQMPQCSTTGQQTPLNKLTDQLRTEIAQAGFTEALTLTLCSHQESFEFLRRPDDGTLAVRLANPKTFEFQVVRTSLLPGMLKVLQSNKYHALPLKVFEISDAVVKSDAHDTGAQNSRQLCATHYGLSSGFEIVHGLLDRVMLLLQVKRVDDGDASGYYLRAIECTGAIHRHRRRADAL